jgi:hypothetical protein
VIAACRLTFVIAYQFTTASADGFQALGNSSAWKGRVPGTDAIRAPARVQRHRFLDQLILVRRRRAPEGVARRWLDLVFEAGDLAGARELSVPELHDQLAEIAYAGTLIDPATWTFSADPQGIVDGQLVMRGVASGAIPPTGRAARG